MTSVLLVDTDITALEHGNRLLQSEYGFSVVNATSSQEALGLLQNSSFDVIVSEYHLPEKNGVLFFHELKEMGTSSQLILYTGEFGEEMINLVLHNGVDYYLCKRGDRISEFGRLAEIIMHPLRDKPSDMLERMREQLNMLIIKSPLAVVWLDPDEQVALWNHGAERIFGWKEHEVLGKRIPIIPEDSAQEFQSIKERVLQGESVESIETRRMKKDGTLIEISISAAPLHDNLGNIIGSLAVFEDISERKQMERAVAESERQLRTILSSLSVGVVLIDPETHVIVDTNPAATELIGHSKEKIVGSVCYKFICPAEVGQCPITSHGQKMDNSEREIINSDGMTTPVLKTVMPVMLGTSTYLLESFIDITEQKSAESALQMANNKLNLVTSVTRHDVLNQVMALQGYLELVKEYSSDETFLRYIEKGYGITEMIRGQVEFANIYRNIGIQSPVWYNLPETVRDACRSIQTDDVRVEIDLGRIEILADLLLERVFSNLLDNAIRHGEGISRFTCSQQMNDNDLQIICEDDGAGITGEMKPHLFNRGWGENTGLGLFLTKEILSITGLSIYEEGAPGSGARFVITVPEGKYRFMEA